MGQGISPYKEFFSFFFFFLLIKTGYQFLKRRLLLRMARKRRYSRPRRRRRRRYYRKRRAAGLVPLKRLRPLQFRSSGRTDTMITKLVYSDIYTLNPGAGTTDFRIMRCNDLFDPDSTGVGHQPRGFDELVGFYNRYLVLYSRITVTCSNSVSTPTTLALGRRNDSYVFTSISDVLEYPTSRWKVVNANTMGVKLRAGFNGVKQFGKRYLYDDIFQAAVTTSPDERPIFFIYAFAADGTSDPGPINVTVRMEFIVKFFESLQPPES